MPAHLFAIHALASELRITSRTPHPVRDTDGVSARMNITSLVMVRMTRCRKEPHSQCRLLARPFVRGDADYPLGYIRRSVIILSSERLRGKGVARSVSFFSDNLTLTHKFPSLVRSSTNSESTEYRLSSGFTIHGSSSPQGQSVPVSSKRRSDDVIRGQALVSPMALPLR